MDAEPKKERRGRKKSKKDVKVTSGALEFPTLKDSEGKLVYPRKLPQERVEGPYRRLKNTEVMLRNNKNVLTIARAKMVKVFQAMDVTDVKITCTLPKDNAHVAAVDKEILEPGVALYFFHADRVKVMCCDRYTTVIANMNACIDAVQAIHLLVRSGCETDFSAVLRKYSNSTALSRPKNEQVFVPSKAHFASTDWEAVLEYSADEVDGLLPKDKSSVKKKLGQMMSLYHPDSPGYCANDKGASVQVIHKAARYILGCFPDEREAIQEKSREVLKEKAEERRKLREERKAAQEEAAKDSELQAKAAAEANQKAEPEQASKNKNFLTGHEWREGPNEKATTCKYCDTLKSRADDGEVCESRMELNEAVDDSDIDDSQESETDDRTIDDSFSQEYNS